MGIELVFVQKYVRSYKLGQFASSSPAVFLDDE